MRKRNIRTATNDASASAIEEFVESARKLYGDRPTMDQLTNHAMRLGFREQRSIRRLRKGTRRHPPHQIDKAKARLKVFKTLGRHDHRFETRRIFIEVLKKLKKRNEHERSATQSPSGKRTSTHSRDTSSQSSATQQTTASSQTTSKSEANRSSSSGQRSANQSTRVYSSADGTYRSSPPTSQSADASATNSTSGQYRSGPPKEASGGEYRSGPPKGASGGQYRSGPSARRSSGGTEGTSNGQYRSGPPTEKVRAETVNDDLDEADDDEMTWLRFSSLVFAQVLRAGGHDTESYEYELAKRLLSVYAFSFDDDSFSEELRLSMSGMSLTMALLETLRDRAGCLIRLTAESTAFPDEIVRLVLRAAVAVAAFDDIIYHEEMHSLQLLAAALGVAQEELATFVAEHGKRKSSRSHTKGDEREKAYEILGVDIGADTETIRVAYRRLIRRHHPDLAAPHERDAATMRTSELNAAYAILIK